MTFPAPTFMFEHEQYYDTIRTNFPAGSIQRASRYGTKERLFTVSYLGITKADRDLIEAEFLAAKGKAGTTSFTPVDEVSAVTVRFDQDELEWRQVTGNTYDTQFRLVQEVF